MNCQRLFAASHDLQRRGCGPLDFSIAFPLGRLLLIMLISAAFAPPASATRVNGPPVVDEEPATHKSFLLGLKPGGPIFEYDPAVDIRDDVLASMIFDNPILSVTSESFLFTMGQCHSSGFLNDLAYLNRNAATPRTQNIGFAAACHWGECSFSGGVPTENTFLRPWAQAVDAPHPANDTFLGAFTAANAADGAATSAQYYSSGAAIDALTLADVSTAGTDYAILYVGDTNGRPDYFDDMDRIRNVLINEYGYLDANIYELYGDMLRKDASAGNGAGNMLPVGFAYDVGTLAGLTRAIDALDDVWTDADGLFFWASNHGYEVPEPSALMLLACSGVVVFVVRRQR